MQTSGAIDDREVSRKSGPTPAEILAQPAFRALLRLAAPTTGVMSVAALSNILNTYFVSRLGAEAIAAVSLVFPITLILTTLMGGGIGAGISSAVARALGASRGEDAKAVAEHAFALAGTLGILLSLALVSAAPTVFRGMGASGGVLDSAVAFGRVLFAGLTLTFMVATCDSILRGAGNVRIPAIYSTLSLVTQIALTPLFMFTLGFGIRGAPAATLTGQLIGFLPRLPHVFGRRSLLRPRLLPRRVQMAPLSGILRVGVPASLGTLLNYLGMIVLTIIMARLGTAELAAYGLGSRFDFLLLTLCYGTGIAVLTLVGFAFGAERVELVGRYIRRAVLLMVAAVSAPAAILYVWPDLWFGIFTDDPAIHAVGQTYFHIIGLSYPFLAISMTLAFSFQGIGRATIPLGVMAIRVSLVVIGALLLTLHFGSGVDAVFALVAAAQALSAVLLLTAMRMTVTTGPRRG